MGRLPRPSFKRFFPAWLAFGASASTASFLVLLPLAIISGPGEVDDAPPLLVVMLCFFIWCWASVVGLVVVPFRHLFVGPRFPFARRGFALVAAAPLLFLLLPEVTWVQGLALTAEIDVILVLALLIFVKLSYWFGAYDEAPAAESGTLTGG